MGKKKYDSDYDSCGRSCEDKDSSKQRMCKLTKKSYKFDLEKVKELSRNPRYICKCCGKKKKKKENLCKPVDLG